jgi:hypothetical protein
MYNPTSPYTVYCNSCYRSDSWDPRTYAKEYDFSRSFFEQLQELLLQVPKNALYSTTGAGEMIHSEFTNCCGGLKNCYLCFNCTWLEDCAYSRGLTRSTETLDSYFGSKLDQCYEVVNGQQSGRVTHSKNVIGCVDSHFLLNTSGLTNCFGCVNLRNKSYCFLNEQLSKEEYEERVAPIMGSYQKMREFQAKFDLFASRFPRRSNNNLNVSNSSGDYLSGCKDAQYCFEIKDGENCKWCFASREIKDSYGTVGYGIKSELLLEVTATGFSSRAIGCWACELSQNIEYCVSCFPSNTHLVGCDSMRNAEYCILNKQYSKEEYERLRNHIVSELTRDGIYGLMLPSALTPFGYNETVAQDNFPLTKEKALALGFRWEDDIQETRGKRTIASTDIPDRISDVTDSITKEVLSCIECDRNYRITSQELLFYRKMSLPIPRQCFFCRHRNRIVCRGPYQFWNRECNKCRKGIITNYAPERPETIYCESCYQQEVI